MPDSPIQALRIAITGRVQGVGFRPFVARLADEFKLTGRVRNRGGEVEIRAEGAPENLAAFARALSERAPPLAKPDPPQVRPAEVQGFETFVIDASEAGEDAAIHIPPDYFVCDECLAELQNPAERRYRYPFVNCTQCGPRYTLIDALPYDRPNTAMAGFTLCPAYRREYENPLDRRYHAQPLACAACGPTLTFRRPGREDIGGDEAALAACIQALRAGDIVAAKGVGGYHLLCDAGDEAAVRRLRERKRRPDKPLAVLAPSLDYVVAAAEPEACELELLNSPLRPIVLMRKRLAVPAGTRSLAESIAPGLQEIGWMLPYSPLHHLLAESFAAPLVATSGNISGEPVLTEAAEVEARLSHVADAFLHHDRPIRRPADDSVFRRADGEPRPIRLGRGLAPVERAAPFAWQGALLAVGSDLKNTVALSSGGRLIVSPHIGDLGSVRGEDTFAQVIADLSRLYRIEPEAIACDAHPDYRSARWARADGRPVHAIYHHHAHASAWAGEYALEGDSLVFAWDGAGYGEDGSVWGGEALLGHPGAWRRIGSLRPFRLPGGDRASREPWRCALSLCWEIGLDWPECPQDAAPLRHAWERGLNCPLASSAGRLFDAASALLGVCREASFEGQAAMRLEAVSQFCAEGIPLPLARDASGLYLIDWSPLLPMLMDGRRGVAERGGLFHASLARAITALALRAREEWGVARVGLTGGVFQNRALGEQTLSLLRRAGFEARLPRAIPANDAGLSFGQLVELAARLQASALQLD